MLGSTGEQWGGTHTQRKGRESLLHRIVLDQLRRAALAPQPASELDPLGEVNCPLDDGPASLASQLPFAPLEIHLLRDLALGLQPHLPRHSARRAAQLLHVVRIERGDVPLEVLQRWPVDLVQKRVESHEVRFASGYPKKGKRQMNKSRARTTHTRWAELITTFAP